MTASDTEVHVLKNLAELELAYFTLSTLSSLLHVLLAVALSLGLVRAGLRLARVQTSAPEILSL
jgi:hypothetical protein